MLFRFLEFELDAGRFELCKNGTPVNIQPQALVILFFLLQQRDKLVRKQDIMLHLWEERLISDSALSSQIKALRRILGDDGQTQRVIQTVYGRGFRFIVPVEVIATQTGSASPKAIAPSEKLPDNIDARAGAPPVIAVLPLCKIGDMQEFPSLPEALPAEITTALSQLRWLFVIARSSSFRFAAQNPDLDQMRRELKIDYVLTGSIELVGDKLLIGSELTETRQHRLIWAKGYEAPINKIHEMRAQMVQDIIEAVDLTITDVQAARAKLRAPDNLTAWDSYHLGMSSVNKVSLDLETAFDHFQRARSQEPTFSRAHAGAAYVKGLSLFHLAEGKDMTAATQDMLMLGEQALNCDPFDPFAHLVVGRAERLSGHVEGALSRYNDAIAYCPNYPEAHNSRAAALLLKGQYAEAYDAADLAIRLSPKCSKRFEAETTQACAALQLGKDAEALALCRRLTGLPHNSPLALFTAITVFHHLGFEQEAKQVCQRIVATGIEPRTTVVQTFPDSASILSEQILTAVSHYFKRATP